MKLKIILPSFLSLTLIFLAYSWSSAQLLVLDLVQLLPRAYVNYLEHHVAITYKCMCIYVTLTCWSQRPSTGLYVLMSPNSSPIHFCMRCNKGLKCPPHWWTIWAITLLLFPHSSLCHLSCCSPRPSCCIYHALFAAFVLCIVELALHVVILIHRVVVSCPTCCGPHSSSCHPYLKSACDKTSRCSAWAVVGLCEHCCVCSLSTGHCPLLYSCWRVTTKDLFYVPIAFWKIRN